jgi:D-alanyl-lipoteichoic acid acyltransferase DltB (MBOAT superfamily)
MLFNSFPFLFVFLPVAFVGALLLFRNDKTNLAIWYLGFCSLTFYAYWNPIHLLVIVPSIGANFLLGSALLGVSGRRRRMVLLVTGIVLNLGLLGYFKYTGFFFNTLSSSNLADFTSTIVNVSLPIGISFYTFQQIAFLADCWSNVSRKSYSFCKYLFFVSFFPQLIAGPIVHHAEIIPQISHVARRVQSRAYVTRFLTPGLALLALGIIKKVLIADSFGTFADHSFEGVTKIGVFGFLDAWGGATAYTFQIYFDFSAYSDMAIGLGLMFGLRLPQNFLSPYKATSIIDFWRRWHVTLSRFLRDYLYIPLGGNRKGPVRRHANLMITMLLGGLWHGASWSFVLWGGLHGVLLIINHLMRRFFRIRFKASIAVPVTFLLLVFTWVPFRAANIVDVQVFYENMLGLNGIVVPWRYGAFVDMLGGGADLLGIRVGDVNYFSGLRQVALSLIGLGIVFFVPNGVEIFAGSHRRRALRSRALPIGLGFGFVVALLAIFMTRNVTFLYFQF